MTLEPHSPSSPTRPPVEHFYFTIFDQDSEQHRFFTHGFGALYAAAHWLQRLMSTPATQRWIDNNHLEFDHNGWRLIVKGSHLEDCSEYQPNKEERSWTPPHPDNVALDHLTRFWIQASTHKDDAPTPKPTKSAPPQRHKTTKPAPDGQITVAQLAANAQIQPNKARNILRKAKITKPKQGWTFPINDPQVKVIRDLLAKG
jgi:hypothetical protein